VVNKSNFAKTLLHSGVHKKGNRLVVNGEDIGEIIRLSIGPTTNGLAKICVTTVLPNIIAQ
jgi:hypothetical protein